MPRVIAKRAREASEFAARNGRRPSRAGEKVTRRVALTARLARGRREITDVGAGTDRALFAGVDAAPAYERHAFIADDVHGAIDEANGFTEEQATEPIASTTELLATAVWEPFRDAWLAARTRFALLIELGVDASDVQVEAYRGSVILAGDVTSSEASAAAEETARGVPGVVGVSNRLHVPEMPTARASTDAEVRAAVTAELRHARALRGSIVVVDSVYDGIVRLTGVARDAVASGMVFALAAAVPGVRRVINDVTLSSDAADGDSDADAA